MRRTLSQSRAAVGFTVKSGWAAAVLLHGSASSAHVLDSCKVDLSDPENPDARQPYHAGFGTARTRGPELAQLITSVERFGRQSVTRVLQQYNAAGHHLRGVGLIVGSLIDPEHIANDHIRIHALEGRLFRGIVEAAATRTRLPCSIWRERDLYGVAAEMLRQPESAVRNTLTALGREVAGSWSAEQKAAALGAWLVLAQGAPPRRTTPARRTAVWRARDPPSEKAAHAGRKIR